MTRATLQKKLKEMNIWNRTTEEFGNSEGGLWLSAEHGSEFDYSDYLSDDRSGYTMGCRNDLHKLLENNGWTFEWEDGGTIMLWKN